MNDQIDEFSDLLGVYALDAVDETERQAIEDHLVTCPRCRAEVAEHREVAAFLSQTGAPAPDAVWDRIAAELSPPAPPVRLSFTPLTAVPARSVDPLADSTSNDAPTSDGVVVSMDGARRSRAVRVRTFVAAISAAAVIVAVLTGITVNQTRRLDHMETSMNGASIDRLANRAVGRATVRVHLDGAQGGAEAVVDAEGQGYLITDGLPSPAEGDVYQLWGKVDDTVLSLGTFGAETEVVPFRIDPSRLDGVQAFAVTNERAPGVVASKQKVPVVAGTV